MVSSTNSCAPVQPLTDPASIEQALMNVAERSFFAFAEPADLSLADALTADGPAMIASVSFTGPTSGSLAVTMSVSLIRELAQAFSGDPDQEFTPADLIDMAGEFANMVTGSWLTATEPNAIFNLTMPDVRDIATAAPVSRMMQINGQPVGLTWQVG